MLLPLSAEITIPMTADPQLASYLCEQGLFGEGSGGGGGGPVGMDGGTGGGPSSPEACPLNQPLPGGPASCHPHDNTVYVSYSGPAPTGLCATSNPPSCEDCIVTRDPAQPPPAGWPCP